MSGALLHRHCWYRRRAQCCQPSAIPSTTASVQQRASQRLALQGASELVCTSLFSACASGYRPHADSPHLTAVLLTSTLHPPPFPWPQGGRAAAAARGRGTKRARGARSASGGAAAAAAAAAAVAGASSGGDGGVGGNRNSVNRWTQEEHEKLAQVRLGVVGAEGGGSAENAAPSWPMVCVGGNVGGWRVGGG
jgi:hypothetical protein